MKIDQFTPSATYLIDDRVQGKIEVVFTTDRPCFAGDVLMAIQPLLKRLEDDIKELRL